MTPIPTILHVSLFLKASLLDSYDRSVLFTSLILTLLYTSFICTPGKCLRGKYRDTDRQMKPLFFKCHDSKRRCKEGGATTCTHSLQSLKQGLKLRASGACSVICCKRGMKEAGNKITRFVHLLKRKKSSVLKCLYLCCGSGHSKPPRQQYLWHCFCAR